MDTRVCIGQRITPAHAGTTTTITNNYSDCEDHPRSRGNYVLRIVTLIRAIGSPPLTRELHNGIVGKTYTVRITPAHAGTTVKLLYTKFLMEDHPRSRGNYFFLTISIKSDQGSPPLTRELQAFP